MKIRVLALSLIFLISACSTQAPVQYEVANLPQSESLPVADLRPETEAKQELFSYLIGSEAYGIYRIGEASTGLNPVRLFQHRVYEKFSPETSEVDAKIHHLVVYMNMKGGAKKGAAAAVVGGVVGSLIASSTEDEGQLPIGISHVDQQVFESLSGEEYKRAFYTEEENPQGADAILVYLDAEINGKRTFLRQISSTNQEGKTQIFLKLLDQTIETFLTAY